MNYPFLYKSIDTLDINEIKKSLIYTNEKTPVWDDWQLVTIESEFVRNYLTQKFSHLKLFNNKLYISDGASSNFHLDRFHIYHILHRLLIPLNDNYHYEWVINEKISSYKPRPGEVLLFNNMVPHRFVAQNNERREVVYLDLYDPLAEGYLNSFKGNYSEENGLLEKKYK